MTGTSVNSGSGTRLTSMEIEEALAFLAESAKGVAQAVHGLSETQLIHRENPDRWSIADVLEHLALLEELFGNAIVMRLQEAPTGAPVQTPSMEDARLRSLVSDRTVSVITPGRISFAKAPQGITPTGRWTPVDSLRRFRNGRNRTAEFLRTASAGLRARVMEHPALGMLDGYQWVLFLAAHSVRHTKQILELKAEPGFPGQDRGYFAVPSETVEFPVDERG
jgi:DinB family protein